MAKFVTSAGAAEYKGMAALASVGFGILSLGFAVWLARRVVTTHQGENPNKGTKAIAVLALIFLILFVVSVAAFISIMEAQAVASRTQQTLGAGFIPQFAPVFGSPVSL
jgi:peptidoglycan biosynthesis protein MviN/MurJ (putative lipid II flippase)